MSQIVSVASQTKSEVITALPSSTLTVGVFVRHWVLDLRQRFLDVRHLVVPGGRDAAAARRPPAVGVVSVADIREDRGGWVLLADHTVHGPVADALRGRLL